MLSLSERGCGVEAPHIDDSIARRHCALSARVRAQRAEPAVGVPLVSVVAVQSGTRLLVWPGSHRVVAAMNGGRERPGPAASPIAPEVVQLSVGDVLLLRADVLHAGAACPDDANLHIRHTWTMVADVPAVDDTTTPGVKAEWPDTTADTRPVMTWTDTTMPPAVKAEWPDTTTRPVMQWPGAETVFLTTTVGQRQANPGVLGGVGIP